MSDDLVFVDPADLPVTLEEYDACLTEALNQFRGMGYADLRALREQLVRRAGSIDVGENPDPKDTRTRAKFFLAQRAHAAKMLMRLIEEKGPSIPKATDPHSAAVKVELEDLWETLTSRQKDNLLRNKEIRAEFQERRKEESAQSIKEDLMERHNLSEGALGNIIYPIND